MLLLLLLEARSGQRREHAAERRRTPPNAAGRRKTARRRNFYHWRAFMRACSAFGELSRRPLTWPLYALKFLLVHTGHFIPRE